MFLVGFAVTFFGFRHVTSLPEYSDELLELFFTYNSLNVVMMTIPFFLLAKKVNVRSELVRKLLANLTICGFGVYMVHFFFTGPRCPFDACHRGACLYSDSGCSCGGIYRIVVTCQLDS